MAYNLAGLRAGHGGQDAADSVLLNQPIGVVIDVN